MVPSCNFSYWSHLVQSCLIFMQQSRAGRIRQVLSTSLAALIDFCLSWAAVVFLLGSTWIQLYLPARPLSYGSICHFTLEHCAEMSLRGLCISYVATVLELRFLWGAAFVCVVRILTSGVLDRSLHVGSFPFAPHFHRQRHQQGWEKSVRIPEDPPIFQVCLSLAEKWRNILSGACQSIVSASFF